MNWKSYGGKKKTKPVPVFHAFITKPADWSVSNIQIGFTKCHMKYISDQMSDDDGITNVFIVKTGWKQELLDNRKINKDVLCS